MKVHTQEFKDEIKKHGKQIDSIITYEAATLTNEELISVIPHYEGAILKSVMKQLDIESTVDIPIGTEINYEFGVKTRDEETEDYRENYDYIDFGKYYVYSSEKQEATNSYKIVCYDLMLKSMKDYETMGNTYPITIRNYLNTICNFLGIEFASINVDFANYNRQIQQELYLDNGGNSLDYTFRDVLDEIAQVTGSTICINKNNQLEVRYITSTNDYIDKEYLKDINVNFGKKYGPINSIVLSRSAESDNVYIQDQSSIEQNGLCEIKIKDNQIMNWNDRSSYLPDLLLKLGGLEFYINDFTSTGICYYDLCDRYGVTIDETTYSCVMFNDEINVTQGLYEIIHTEAPEEGETDYTKADKTDRRINQTYLIVDKQNQEIQSVISNVGIQDQKISQINQKVDEISAQISEISDITTSGESSYATVRLDNVNQSEPIMLKIRPTGENISYLYPRTNLYPSDTLYMTDRIIRFYNRETDENIDYTLPDDLLYYDSTHYDEFYLDYESQTCEVIKRCKYNADGTVGLLSTETINSYSYPTIVLTTGDYDVSILGYNYGYISVRLMASNIYTNQFYTKVETNSLINQTASSIDLSVNQKLSNYSTTEQMNSAISIKANEITSTVSQTYSTKTETTQAKNEAISSANDTTDDKLEDYSTTTEMTSAINQKANEITSTVSQTYATKTTTNALSSRISQTAKSIDLTVTDNGTSAGLNIKLKNEDGDQIDSENANITLSGLVKFEDLSTSGSTTINGANIQTGTLSASKITTGTLNGNNVTITNLNASNIKSGTLTSRAINNGSGTFTVSTGGNIYARSGTIGGWSLNSGYLYATSSHDNKTYKLSAQGVDNGFAIAYWGNIMQASSDKKLKNNIDPIDKKFNEFYDSLKPVTFYYNKGVADEKKHIGFVAQDIIESQKLINEDLSMVEKVKEYDSYNLDKREIIALNTWQIQLLKQEIKELKKEIEELKKGK